MMSRQIALFGLTLALMSAAVAQTGPASGNYILDRDSGTLQIRQDDQGRMRFDLETVGGNCHICRLSGVIESAIGHTEGDDGPRCDIRFDSKGSAVALSPITDDTCQDYCGMRGSFKGTYRTPPPSCTNDGKQAQRDKALGLYRAHRYAEAAALLRAMSAQCADFINWIDIDAIRNDLALAQYHQGEYAQCVQTLNTTLAGKVKDEAQLKAGTAQVRLPPCDFDNYIEIAKASWFNKALCMKAMNGKR